MNYTLAIKNGLIVDGSGKPPFKANLYISGNKIAKISTEDLPADSVTDACGLVVSPGFIDMHSHSDISPWKYPKFESRLHQGVTTDIGGNCGSSFIPNNSESAEVHSMAEMKKDLSTRKIGVNFNTFIGHGELRMLCMKDPYAKVPTDEELEKMKALLDRELTDGACGMSIGLEYMPGYNCDTHELVELAKIVKKHGKLCPIHSRNESRRIWQSLEEIATIARESGVHMHVSHLKIMFSDNWGKADELLSKIDQYRREGLDISCDQYPYLATSTSFPIMMPGWSKEGSHAEITARIKNDEEWLRMRDDVQTGMDNRGGPTCIVVCSNGGRYKEIEGKSIAQISEMLNMEPIDVFRYIMIRCESRISGVFHTILKEDALKIMQRPDVAVVSDSRNRDFITGTTDGIQHPRATSSAVKFLRTVREYNLMPIETAVMKLTYIPAAIMNLSGRGLLDEGYFADVVIFDPETVADRGTYESPYQTSVGIKEVFVNGVSSWRDGVSTGNMAGTVAENCGIF